MFSKNVLDMVTSPQISPELLLIELFPEKPELVRDEELLGDVRDAVNAEEHRISRGATSPEKASMNIKTKVVKGVEQYLKWQEVMSLPEQTSPTDVYHKTGVHPTTVTRWRQGSVPHFASKVSKAARARKRESIDRSTVMAQIKDITLQRLKAQSTNSKDEGAILQNIIYVNDEFLSSSIKRTLRRLGLTYYEAAVEALVAAAIQEGKEPLRIQYYGNQPLALWMFQSKLHRKFDYPGNRVAAVTALYNALGRFPSKTEFRTTNNPLHRSFEEIRLQMKELYGTGSVWIAYAESWIINALNYRDTLNANPTLPLSFEQVVEINKKAVNQMVRSGIPIAKVAESLHLPQDIVIAIINPKYKAVLEGQLEAAYERFHSRSKHYKNFIRPEVLDLHFDGTEHTEKYLVVLAKNLNRPVRQFAELERLTVILRGGYSIYL